MAQTDEVDGAIIEELHHADPCGMFPLELAYRLECSSAHTRMNKKLDRLIGQKAAEKVGKGWALTTFKHESWGSTKEEIISENVNSCPPE